jgi:hypothetical protein
MSEVLSNLHLCIPLDSAFCQCGYLQCGYPHCRYPHFLSFDFPNGKEGIMHATQNNKEY